jgi:hypothetical protein
MASISNSIARAVDNHATEMILCALAMPFLGVWVYKPSDLLGSILVGLVGGILAISRKRSTGTTSIENVEGDVDATTTAAKGSE